MDRSKSSAVPCQKKLMELCYSYKGLMGLSACHRAVKLTFLSVSNPTPTFRQLITFCLGAYLRAQGESNPQDDKTNQIEMLLTLGLTDMQNGERMVLIKSVSIKWDNRCGCVVPRGE